ncbi:MAG: YraN family protein [Ignavibacteriales bacterium]|nr:YraN family protein [Ignavibacteriales bacterium]
MANNKRASGEYYEELAVEFLKEKHFEILARNFHIHHGEIDIVAKENSTLVFVEVKARTSNAFGTPEEAITEKKQRTLRKTADGFILKHPEIPFNESRFDVIAIENKNGKTEIRHLIDAF